MRFKFTLKNYYKCINSNINIYTNKSFFIIKDIYLKIDDITGVYKYDWGNCYSVVSVIKLEDNYVTSKKSDGFCNYEWMIDSIISKRKIYYKYSDKKYIPYKSLNLRERL